MDRALYYPYINLPETDWTMRTLLYYDSVGSIVPREYFYNPNRNYEPFMLKLIKAELVIPIDPIATLEHPRDVYQPLLKFIDSRKSFLKGKSKVVKNSRVHYEKFDGTRIHAGKFGFDRVHGDKFRMHEEKFQAEIFYHLEHMGLARRGYDNWYLVESRTAAYMMKFLATVVSSKLKMRMATNSIDKSAALNLKTRNRKRNIILKELIPFPEEINLTKLRNFKDKHNGILNQFKNRVEQIVLEDKVNENSKLFKERVNELKLHKEELSARMNESKFKKIFFGTVCGTVGAVPGIVTTNTNAALLGALPGFANAIYSALQIERAEDLFDQTGMKYIALVDKRLR